MFGFKKIWFINNYNKDSRPGSPGTEINQESFQIFSGTDRLFPCYNKLREIQMEE